eukprot:TRINITY_DN774_c0_g1_i2.p1 TRINITY_DN774_c0_g1~~TRINITY_DN774_c0_g1_i2.p1  ORF type:complete len:186 (-),score=57.35 TRINITY_DN774_c0_g1_i2:169-726(-)
MDTDPSLTAQDEDPSLVVATNQDNDAASSRESNALNDEIAELKQQVEKLTQYKENAEIAQADATAEVVRLQASLAEKDQKEALQKASEEKLAQINGELEAEKKNNADLQVRIKATEATMKEVERLAAENQDLNQALEEQKISIEEKQALQKAAEEKLAQTNGELEAEKKNNADLQVQPWRNRKLA